MQQKTFCGGLFIERRRLLATAMIGLLGSPPLSATADAPDQVRAQAVAAGKSVEPLAQPPGGATSVAPSPRIEPIRFPKGASSTTIKGQIKGYDTIDYRLRAEAGQTLNVTLTTSNRQTYFNVNPPGTETAMFVGSTSGGRFE